MEWCVRMHTVCATASDLIERASVHPLTESELRTSIPPLWLFYERRHTILGQSTPPEGASG